jgi:hypothetical protein
MRVGAAKTEAGRAFGYVKVQLPPAGQAVTRQSFTFQVDKAKLRDAQLRDGHYLLRTNLVAEDTGVPFRFPRLKQHYSAQTMGWAGIAGLPIFADNESSALTRADTWPRGCATVDSER